MLNQRVVGYDDNIWYKRSEKIDWDVSSEVDAWYLPMIKLFHR